MSTLGLDPPRRVMKERGFFRSQFSPPTSHQQKVFDVSFGVVAPVLCFVFDPLVFRGEFDTPLFPQFQAFVYMVSAIEIVVLIMWLVCGQRLQPRTRLLGGVLTTGALFSGLIGIVILPFTLIGLFFGIGIFGFVPFLTALVYLRNARGAFQLAHHDTAAGPEPLAAPSNARDTFGWIGSTVFACALVLGLPAGLNFIAAQLVSSSLNAVLYADSQRADLAAEQIMYLKYFSSPNLDPIVSAYAAETNPSRKEELKRRYSKITGNDIEARLRILAD